MCGYLAVPQALPFDVYLPCVSDEGFSVTPQELATRWRLDAETLARYGDDRGAQLCRLHADDLDAALRDASDELLDLATAAQESGYSADRLRHKVASGEIPNAGRRGAPRLRRGDLPTRRRQSNAFDADQVARSLTSHQ